MLLTNQSFSSFAETTNSKFHSFGIGKVVHELVIITQEIGTSIEKSFHLKFVKEFHVFVVVDHQKHEVSKNKKVNNTIIFLNISKKY